MKPLWTSLRFRLAIAGFCAIYFPVLILWVVVFATSFEDATVQPSSDNGSVSQVSSGQEPTTSPWAVGTVIALAPVAAAAAWWWAGRAVRPINNIQSVVDQIDSSGLDRRLDLERGSSEVIALAASFDNMLDRLHRAAEIQQQLIEETSHELRTPLAVLTTNAEVLLADPTPTMDGYAAGLERSKEKPHRLTTII